jgi:hypothetical protein
MQVLSAGTALAHYVLQLVSSTSLSGTGGALLLGQSLPSALFHFFAAHAHSISTPASTIQRIGESAFAAAC